MRRSLSLAAGVCGLVALAHTPWLSALSPRCPVDFSNEGEREAQRVHALQERRGDGVERTRPALDFELGQSTRAQVQRAFEARGAACNSEHGVLRCSFANARSCEQPALSTANAQFDHDKLVALDVMRTNTDGAQASVWLDALAGTLTQKVGAPTAQYGSALDRGFAQRIVEYRYAHYVAQISALHVGHGVKLREQYQMLPDG